MMITVGLTGKMGSGKTTVLKMFQDLDAGVYIADEKAKFLMKTSIPLRSAIIKEFGTESYKNEELNRLYLSNIVFKNTKKLKALNSLVHPVVNADFEKFISLCDKKYVIYESAILLQNTVYLKKFDYTILVTAPLSVRVDRIIKRDTTTRKAIELRLKNQKYTKKSLLKIDFTIENIQLDKTRKDVFKIHKLIVNNYSILE